MRKSTLLSILSVFILALLLSSCHSSKKSVASDFTHGWVRDFSGLDGCKLLVVLDNGKRLMINQILSVGYEMKAGQEILFKYKILKDATTICGSESAVVNIEYVQVIPPKPCGEFNATKKGWVRDAITRENPIEISRYYDSEKRPHYLFNCGMIRILFDCNGQEECRLEGKVMNDCVRLWMSFTLDKIVWTKESMHR